MPFIPPNTGAVGHFGWTGVFRATGVIFFAYIGFDAVSVAAQEAKNPQRDIPMGMLGSLLICTVLYMLMSYVLTGIAPYHTLERRPSGERRRWKPCPARAGWRRMSISAPSSAWPRWCWCCCWRQSRIFYAMGRDGHDPARLSARSIRASARPGKSSIITGIFSRDAGRLSAARHSGSSWFRIGTLAAFVIVCVGVMVLRVRAPHAKRPFRTPLVWVTAPLGIVMCLFMMVLPAARYLAPAGGLDGRSGW